MKRSSANKLFASLYLVVVVPCTVLAQIPTLVADINPGAPSSNPAGFVSFQDKMFLTATTAANGQELFRTDGSGVPTMVMDFYAGPSSGILGTPLRYNNKLYFLGQEGATSPELMAYDGTNPPAHVPNGSLAFPIKVFNNKLWLSKTTLSNGYELYSFDGINTPVIYEINPGTANSYPHSLIDFNGKLYMNANTQSWGEELFVYDPATDQVTLAADINIGNGSSDPRDLVVVGNSLIFTAFTPNYGRELYAFDGSTLTRLTDLAPGSNHGVGTGLVYFNNKLYFSGSIDGSNYQLYTYDVGSGTSSLFYTFNPNGSSSPHPSIVYNNKLYLKAFKPTTGFEMWTTDGITTSMMPEIGTGATSGVNEDSYLPISSYIFNNHLYFQAGDSATTGLELYRVSATNSIQSLSFNGSATLYPNPARDVATLQLELKSTQTLSVTITDAVGKTHYSTEPKNYGIGKSEIQLPLGNLSSGNYHYALRSESGTLLRSGQFVKQ